MNVGTPILDLDIYYLNVDACVFGFESPRIGFVRYCTDMESIFSQMKINGAFNDIRKQDSQPVNE